MQVRTWHFFYIFPRSSTRNSIVYIRRMFLQILKSQANMHYMHIVCTHHNPRHVIVCVHRSKPRGQHTHKEIWGLPSCGCTWFPAVKWSNDVDNDYNVFQTIFSVFSFWLALAAATPTYIIMYMFVHKSLGTDYVCTDYVYCLVCAQCKRCDMVKSSCRKND